MCRQAKEAWIDKKCKEIEDKANIQNNKVQT